MTSQRTWWERLGPAAALQVAFGAGVTLLKAGSNALVLGRYEPLALPYLYIGAAALTASLTALAAAWGRRDPRDPQRLLLLGAVVSLGIAFAVWKGVASGALLLYLFGESFTTFTAIVFWGAMSDAFDPRESRRAFSWLSGFGMSGGILGGLLAQLLARNWGAVSLVACAGGVLFVGAVIFTWHRPEPGHAAPAPQRHGERQDAWRYLLGHRYPSYLGALVLAFALWVPLSDFVFRERAARTLGEDQLAALFGNVHIWVGLFCVVFQFLFAERVLSRLGVLRYVGALPLVVLPFAALAALSQALWPAYVLRLLESAVSLSILPLGVQLLYAPIPDELRDRARALMDGGVRKGGLALGGLLLIGVGPYLKGPLPAWALCAACAAAAVLLWRLRPQYVAALQERVGDGPPDADQGSDTARLVERELGSGEPDQVLRALAMLEQGGVKVDPHLEKLLAHPSEQVVLRALHLAAGLGAQGLEGAVEQLMASGARRTRAEAAWTLSAVAPGRAAALLPSHLDDQDPGLRCAALGALWRLGGSGVDARERIRALTARGEAAPLAERREVARLLGRVPDPAWAQALEGYLKDADPSVRRIAIEAVGEGGYRSLAPRLLPFLSWREERKSARDALAALGDEVVPMLEGALNDRGRPAALRYELPRVLKQLGTQGALDALLFSNVRDDAFLHYRIGVALSRLKEERPQLRADPLRVRDALRRRRELHLRWVGTYRDLRAALGEASLLTRAVGDRLDQTFELCFWLLGLLYPARTLRRVHEHLVGEDPRRRAYALELFENLVPEEDRELLGEQIHAHHRALPPGAPGRLSDHLGSLCHSDDHVLRACARQVARGVGLWSLPPMEDDMSDATLKRMFALEGVDIFAQSDVDDLAVVAQVAREHRFRQGEQIYDEGDPGDALYVIVKGVVDAYRRGEKVLSLGARESFGEVSLLDGAPRPTKMIAREETTVLVMDRRDFLDLITDRPEILKGIFRTLARQLREVVDLAASRGPQGEPGGESGEPRGRPDGKPRSA